MTAFTRELLQVHDSTGLLADFHHAGVLGVADVHTAEAAARIVGETDDQVRLACALTVRALRNGSVCFDLRTARDTVFDEAEESVDVTGLPWPEAEGWLRTCEASAMVAVGPDAAYGRPLRLAGGLLYLERYWRQEEQVRQELRARYAGTPPAVETDRLRASLARLFDAVGPDGEPDRQRLAAAVSALSWVTVLAGGPGTGKTTTVARLLAVLHDQPGPAPRVALAAPTGKAAARLEEAVRSAAAELPPEDRERLGDLSASTLHRLLGWLPSARGRFRHNADNQLPHDVVIVDEMSMVSLTMMARLLEAVRPSARLVLVGDPDQLSSVDAGAVLADITRAPGAPDPTLEHELASVEAGSSGGPAAAGTTTPAGPVHGVVQLRHTWRYGGAIEDLAQAIRDADGDRAVALLRSNQKAVAFVEVDPSADADPFVNADLTMLAAQVRTAGAEMVQAAWAGDVDAALVGLDRHRLLCAHRTGPYGVLRWGLEAERWLGEAVPGYAEDGEWHVGRPLLVTANDYDLGLYNGDTGLIVNTAAGVRAAFSRGATPSLFSPVRLDAIQTVHAMTVHRAQGSQFDQVSFVVPPPESPLLTRELLYTAVTRAQHRVLVIGSEEAIRRAISRPANRASGLSHRLGALAD